MASRVFTGGMDQDSDEHRIAPIDYRYALHIEGGHGSIVGAKRTVYGNRKINYTFPAGGDYQCVGGIEDKSNNSYIYFVRDNNDPDNGHILEYKEGTIRKLLNANIQGGFNDFIHSSAIVNDCLYWVDGQDYEDGTGAQGSDPKKICLPRFRANKVIRYELVLNEDCLLQNVQFRYSLYNVDGVLTQSPTLFQTNIADGQLHQIMLALFNNLDNAGFTIEDFPVNSADAPARRIVFYRGTDIRVKIEVTGGSGTPEIQLNELNFYPLPSDDHDVFSKQIRLIKPTPLFPPSVQYEKDTSIGVSNLAGKAFQFRYRYVFVDGEKSAWGPASRIPTNFGYLDDTDKPQVNSNDENFNKIAISIDDEYTQSPWTWMVRGIEVCFRTNRIDPWRLVGAYNVYDFYVNTIVIDFYNTGINSVIPSDDVGDSDIQALKNYDFVPRIANSIERIYDESGNSLIVIGGMLEDYDLIDQAATITVTKNAMPDLTEPTQTSQNKYVKRGGKYKIGAIFKDDMGRQTSVVPLGEAQIPFRLEAIGDTFYAYDIQVDILTPVPTGTQYWQLAISENQNQEVYWQASANKILEYRYDEETGEIESGSFLGNRHYYGFHFNLSELDPNYSPNGVLFDLTEGQAKVFVPETRDRIQVFKLSGTYNPSNPPIDANIEDYNYEIKGYAFITTASVTELVVLIDGRLPLLDCPAWAAYTGNLDTYCEVYRPKVSADSVIYYEVGPVYGPTTGFGFTSTNGYGDTYITSMVTKTNIVSSDYMEGVERPTLYPANTIPEWDFGRAVAYDPNYKERNKPRIIRHSDILVQHGETNGLSSFRGGNYFTIPEPIGAIKKLVLNQNVLLAVGSLKTQPIYVSRDRLLTLSGELVGRSDRVFNVADELRYDLGTVNPESVLYEGGVTYGFHFKSGEYWRYTSGSGQFPISRFGMISPFLGLSNFYTSKPSPFYKSPVGFERRTRSLFVSNFTFTATFQEDDSEPKWLSYHDFRPEWYGLIGPIMLSFKDGELWVHDSTATRANFYGVQKPTRLGAIINDQPFDVKLFDCLEIQATLQMHVRTITISDSGGYGSMLSEIRANRFTRYEGRFKADFLRDRSDPNPQFDSISDPEEQTVARLLRGRHLRGKAMYIELTQTNTGQDCIITGLYVYYVPSNQTVNTQ